MKRRVLIGILKVIAVSGLVMIIAGCSPGGDSPQDIVNSFFDDINGNNLGNLRSYLDTDAGDAPPTSYWETEFQFAPYEISLSGSGPVNATATGTGGNQTFRFEFSGSEGDLFSESDYRIEKIIETSGSSEVTIFPRSN